MHLPGTPMNSHPLRPPSMPGGRRFVVPPAALVDLGRSLRELHVAMLQLRAEESSAESPLRLAREYVQRALEAISDSGLLPQPDATQEPWRRPRYGFGPVMGAHNPVFPEPQCRHADGVTHGTVSFPLPFEGPPGFVHGGFIALFFDQVLGQHNMAFDVSGMTARLDVEYHRPTPLGRTLSFEVEGGRTDSRTTVTRGCLRDRDQVLARAEGVFVVPRGGMPTGVR